MRGSRNSDREGLCLVLSPIRHYMVAFKEVCAKAVLKNTRVEAAAEGDE